MIAVTVDDGSAAKQLHSCSLNADCEDGGEYKHREIF